MLGVHLLTAGFSNSDSCKSKFWSFVETLAYPILAILVFLFNFDCKDTKIEITTKLFSSYFEIFVVRLYFNFIEFYFYLSAKLVGCILCH